MAKKRIPSDPKTLELLRTKFAFDAKLSVLWDGEDPRKMEDKPVVRLGGYRHKLTVTVTSKLSKEFAGCSAEEIGCIQKLRPTLYISLLRSRGVNIDEMRKMIQLNHGNHVRQKFKTSETFNVGATGGDNPMVYINLLRIAGGTQIIDCGAIRLKRAFWL